MITLFGHGYIGSAIAKCLKERNLYFYWAHHDEDWLPIGEAVINAAGYTGRPNVDACEDQKAKCLEANLIWPLELHRRSSCLPVIHVTSGCLYAGSPPGGFTEEDPPNFGFDNGSFYSGTKALAQKALKPYLNRSYLLRIRMPFGPQQHPKNLLTKFGNYPKLINGLNSLSCLEDVARVAVHFALTRPKPGIYNVVNPGAIETRELIEMMGLRKEWFTPEEFRAAVKAPRSMCVLNSEKLQAVFPLDDVRTALNKCLIPVTQAVLAAA